MAYNVCGKLTLNSLLLSALNAFQNESLRRILHIPPTFSQTGNRLLLLMLACMVKIRKDYGCSVEHFADTRRKAKFRLFGHVWRASQADPLVQATFKTDGLTLREMYIEHFMEMLTPLTSK